MSELIDRQAAIDAVTQYAKFLWKTYHETCNISGMIDAIDGVQTASPWHRVEDGLPEMSEIVPGYVCSEILVLCDVESKYADLGYVREKPDNNGVDWIWGKPRKNPTHWMCFEPPKEDA